MINENRCSHGNKSQIDKIESMLEEILGMMHGEGEILGIKDKVNIMWGYRGMFLGIIAANAVTIILFITDVIKGG